MPFDKAQREYICPCGIGAEPCPDASGRPLCAEHERLTGEGWRLGPDGCYRKDEQEACENCMNTGLKNPTAEDLRR